MSAHEHPTDDRLLDLVNGLLPDSEQRETVQHVRACQACAPRLREFAASHARAFARSLDVFAAATPRLARLPAPLWRSPGLALAAAASVLVVGAGVYFGMLSPPAGRLTGSAWLPQPRIAGVTRDSAEVATNEHITRGLAAYRGHDAALAARLLSGARADGPLEQVRLLYLGSAELQLGEPRAALAALRRVNLDDVPEPWRAEAEWSTAAAFAGTGQSRAADSVWRELATRGDEVGERARQALASHAGAP